MGPGFESLREHNFYGPVAQLAEATDSKPVQCEFESHPDYKTTFKDIHYKCGVYIKTRCRGNDVVH